MKQTILVALLLFIGKVCCGQSLAELNRLSKNALAVNDFAKAAPLLQKAAEGGLAEAQYNYGVCYLLGNGVPKDDKIANDWFLKAAKQGWVDAQFKIAYSYGVGRGCEKDETQAFFWLQKCARQNDPECMFQLVGAYMQGMGTEKNRDSMLVWATRLGSHAEVENLETSGVITSARKNLAEMYLREGDQIKYTIKDKFCN